MIFHIITLSTYGRGLSGGDRIWIELAKRIGKKYQINVYLWEEGLSIAKREGLKDVSFTLWTAKFWANFGFFINYFARIFIGIFKALTLRIDNSKETVLYSASEFWQDSLPSLILKLRYPKITWIAAWYQTAPNPFIGFRENGIFNILPNLRSTLYFLVQWPIKPIIKKWADFIFITSEPDKIFFPRQNNLRKVIVIKGGVDLDKIEEFKKNKREEKKYDAVFQGRFHPQKGVLELIDIWKRVVGRKADAKLVMIGDGPLMKAVSQKIKEENLEKNVILTGYLFDGDQKHDIFLKSKIVLHPALYDSGGMAAAEAMAFGLPGIAFDLNALKTYYPQGVIKIPIGNSDRFADSIMELLDNDKLYQKLKKEALELIKNYWNWDYLAKKVIAILNNRMV